MPKRNRAREAKKGAARVARDRRIERERRQAAWETGSSPAFAPAAVHHGFAMSDEAWKWSSRNGNPLPVAACGGRHEGRCCGCGEGYCCYAW